MVARGRRTRRRKLLAGALELRCAQRDLSPRFARALYVDGLWLSASVPLSRSTCACLAEGQTVRCTLLYGRFHPAADELHKHVFYHDSWGQALLCVVSALCFSKWERCTPVCQEECSLRHAFLGARHVWCPARFHCHRERSLCSW